MTDFFKLFLSREIVSVAVMLVILLVRLALWKTPKRLTVLLWAVVCFRLLCPVTLEAPVSLVPVAVREASSAVEDLPASEQLPELASDLHRRLTSHTVLLTNRKAYTARQWGRLALDLAPYVWLTGMAVLALSQTLKLLRLRRRLQNAQELSPGVYLSGQLSCAFVLGLFRPQIYLPAGLSPQQERYVLLHEKTHIKRCDHVWKLLALVCLCLHWFDPVVWLCWGLFGRDLELACDEASTASLSPAERCDYAQTLLSLSGENPAFPLPAFSQPEPEKRILRILHWKKPAKIAVILALVLVLLLGTGLAVNPYSKKAIFGQRYQADALLYTAPQFDFTYVGGPYPAYMFSENHMLYEKQPGTSFNECGGLQEISLSSKQLLALFDADWMAPDGGWQPPSGDLLEPDVRKQLSWVKSGWLCKRGSEPQSPFYLVMQSGKQLLLVVGYGWGTDAALARWLFSLTPDETLFTTQELATLIRRSNSLTDQQSIQIYSIYEPENNPGLLFAAYDGDQNGVAVFSYDAARPDYRIRVDTTSTRQDTFYSNTFTLYDLGKSFSIITSHHENAAEVRAVWNGVELTAPITACPAMVVLEWPEELASHTDTSPDIRFYNAMSEELPRN